MSGDRDRPWPNWNPPINPNGTVTIPVSKTVRGRIDRMRRPGETDNQVLRRAFSLVDNAAVAGSASAFTAAERKTAGEIIQVLQGLPKDQARDILHGLRNDQFVLRGKDAEATSVIADLVSARLQSDGFNVLSSTGPDGRPAIVIDGTPESQAKANAAIAEVMAVAANPVLQKLGESCWHKCLAAWQSSTTIVLPKPEEALPADLHDVLNVNPTMFVVQHDWAAAFQNAGDFAEGEYRLPYDEAVFEFRVSGRRCVMSICTDENDHPLTALFLFESTAGWALVGIYKLIDGAWKCGTSRPDVGLPIVQFVGRQIRAIAIALEAEVAVADIVRAPHKLNAKRVKAGKIPLADYHVISLAARKRYQPVEAGAGDVDREMASRRLHFVRGHWRHYQNHKTWIKWHLRGNPDLGFIAKHYTL